MIFRRSRRQPDPGGDVSADDATGEGAVADAALAERAGQPPAGDSNRPDGPWDSSEVSLDEDDPNRVDLGSLLVTARPGVEVRLQVDEASQSVAAVLLATAEGAVELRPFAAPRNADIWDDIRSAIAAEAARRGGTATPAEGPFGTELAISVSVRTPDGQSAAQPSRVLGIRGPRWLLRATILGKPATEPDPGGLLETALREVVVVRGSDPMAPGEPLPLVMPGNAQPLQPPG